MDAENSIITVSEDMIMTFDTNINHKLSPSQTKTIDKTNTKTNDNKTTDCKKTVKSYSRNDINKMIKQNRYIKNVLYKKNMDDAALIEDLSASKVKIKEFTVPDDYDYKALFKYDYSKKQLTEICKHHNIAHSGKKADVTLRIFNVWYFGSKAKIIQQSVRAFIRKLFNTKHKPAIHIQKIAKGFIIRKVLREMNYIQYPSKRNVCVNDYDVATMDDLNEIPYKEILFVYEPIENSNKTNIYGFHQDTLKRLIYNFNVYYKRHTSNIPIHGSFKNPWNRVRTNLSVIFNSIKRQQHIKYLLGFIPAQNMNGDANNGQRRRRVRRRRRRRNSSMDETTTATEVRSVFQLQRLGNRVADIPIFTQAQNITTYEEANTFIQEYTREFFMEADQLGNYTDERWFSSLERRQINVLFIELYDLWNVRLRTLMTQTQRRGFFPSFTDANPFNIIPGTYRQTTARLFSGMNNITAKIVILFIMRQFISNSEDRDTRALGANYVLGCLTFVSRDARNALPWLYDAFNY
jgi:hypothetical protein